MLISKQLLSFSCWLFLNFNAILELLLTYINVTSVEKQVLWTICPWKTLLNLVIFDIAEKHGCKMADLFCCTSAFSPSFSGTITITLLLSWAPELSGHDKVARTSREVKLCFRQTSSTFTRPRLSRPTIQNASPQRQLLDFAFSEQVATSYSHHLLPLNANPLLCFWWNAPFQLVIEEMT